MADLQPLIDYLKIDRRSNEAAAKDIYTEAYILDDIYDANNPLDNRTLEILKTEVKDLGKCTPLSELLNYQTIKNEIYVQRINSLDNESSLAYYKKRISQSDDQAITKYKPLQGGPWEVMDDSDFIKIPLVNHINIYYYHRGKNRVIEANILDTVFVFPNVFAYDPKDIPQMDSGSYELSYTDHEGYDNSLFDQALKYLIDPVIKVIRDRMNRVVDVTISQAKGEVN